MAEQGRPLSPFVTVYKWRYTFLNPSVIHRATGGLLTAGLFVLVYFLFALANGTEAYARAADAMGHPLAKLFFVALSWSFFFHLLNGVRHLVWDTGHGFDYRLVRITGLAIYVGASVLAAAYSVMFIY